MKIARHQKILEIIEEYQIETQEELAQKLKEAGFDVTQATVSRDIRQMKLTKIDHICVINNIFLVVFLEFSWNKLEEIRNISKVSVS